MSLREIRTDIVKGLSDSDRTFLKVRAFSTKHDEEVSGIFNRRDELSVYQGLSAEEKVEVLEKWRRKNGAYRDLSDKKTLEILAEIAEEESFQGLRGTHGAP